MHSGAICHKRWVNKINASWLQIVTPNAIHLYDKTDIAYTEDQANNQSKTLASLT